VSLPAEEPGEVLGESALKREHRKEYALPKQKALVAGKSQSQTAEKMSPECGLKAKGTVTREKGLRSKGTSEKDYQ